MKFLVHIYKKLLTLLSRSTNKSITKDKDLFTGSILFGLNNENIFISAEIPQIKSEDIQDITDLAENYANFIVHITSGLVYDEIISILKKKLYDSNISFDKKLLIENILYFIPIIEKEIDISAAKEYLNTQPLVRPVNVFNTNNK